MAQREGRWTHTFYDPLRRVTATRDAAGRTVTQDWCNCGSLDRLIDPNNNATAWERDLRGRVTKEIRVDGSFKTFEYEATTSRLKRVTDAKGQVVDYEYELDGKLGATRYSGDGDVTPDVEWFYEDGGAVPDPHGRLLRMVDGTGTTLYGYHAFGQLGASQLATVDGPLTDDTITYAYDELGRVVSRTLNTVTSGWAYDQQGRLDEQTDPIGTFDYTYDGDTGRVATLSYPNGQTSNYAYDGNLGDRRLLQIHHKKPDLSTLSKFDYTYDDIGNILTWQQQTDANPPHVYDFGYDRADQLEAATLKTTDPTPTVLKRYRYDYDPAGNRTVEQIDDAATGASYDDMNRLVSQQAGGTLLFQGSTNEPATVTVEGQEASSTETTFGAGADVPSGTSQVSVQASDGSGNIRTNVYEVTQSGSPVTFAYDNNGNTISKTEGGVTTTYEWDAENRLLAVKQGGNTLASFTYDGIGRRATKAAGSVTTSYVYDGEGILEERPSAGSTKRLVHGPGIDQLLAQVVGVTETYFVTDHRGSIRHHTDDEGEPALTRDYDPWGNPLEATDSGYAFTGREWDSEAGLYYYRARYYDPAMGRFVSEDPIGFVGGGNFYSYVENNPANFIDPYGLRLLPIPPGTGTKIRNVFCVVVPGFRVAFLHRPNEENNRYAHCLASCLIAESCGEEAAQFAESTKEDWDAFRCRLGRQESCDSAYEGQDYIDNACGRRGAEEGKDCFEHCERLKDVPDVRPPRP